MVFIERQMRGNALNRLYASTGTFIGRANGYDYRLITDIAPKVVCDGFELMMLPAWYGRLSDAARVLKAANVYTPVLHFDKEIGNLLSAGEVDEAKRLFGINCAFANSVGARRGVLHLWGGIPSDGNIGVNLSALPYIYSTAAGYGVEIMIENIPCKVSTPLSRLFGIKAAYPDATFVFDTRFAAFCGEIDAFFGADGMWDGAVSHIHISDYNGGGAERGLIRPILHPGEGVIDFDGFFDRLPAFSGTVTLESPVLSAEGTVDIEKLNATLSYIKKKLAGRESASGGRTTE